MLPLAAIRFNQPILAAFYNPLNFFVYPFAAVIIYSLIVERKINKNILYFILLAGAIVFSILEWKFFTNIIFLRFQGFGIPAYARLSLLFISTFFIVVFYYYTPMRNSKVINYMARNSLALYCLHPFFIHIRLAERFGLEGMPLRIVNLIIIVLLCYVIADFLRAKILRKELIH
jgi:fucose 4-O-acetylase-like acetyltransferase